MCKRKNRKKWPSGLVSEVYFRQQNPYKVGHCWHCGKRIFLDKRRVEDGAGAWHIDHFPVPYKDIVDQCCYGVVDEHDISNLVPACIECNVSHKYEKKYKIFCNRAQCCCVKKCYIILCYLILFILTIISYYIYKYYNEKGKCNLNLFGIEISHKSFDYFGIDSCYLLGYEKDYLYSHFI